MDTGLVNSEIFFCVSLFQVKRGTFRLASVVMKSVLLVHHDK